MSKKFDTIGFIIGYESGELDDESVIEGFQHLIDSGVVWHLQGSYQKTASQLIESGLCERKVIHVTKRDRRAARRLKESAE